MEEALHVNDNNNTNSNVVVGFWWRRCIRTLLPTIFVLLVFVVVMSGFGLPNNREWLSSSWATILRISTRTTQMSAAHDTTWHHHHQHRHSHENFDARASWTTNRDTLVAPETEAFATAKAVFDDLHYRKVCTVVHSSNLCLTVRYPFSVPEQDPTVDYPKPVLEEWYTGNHAVQIIDGPALDVCRDMMQQQQQQQQQQQKGNDAPNESNIVQECLDYHAAQNPDQVVAVFTKTSLSTVRQADDGITTTVSFFGVENPDKKKQFQNYFANQVFWLLGASPSPGIFHCLQEMFGYCARTDRLPGGTKQLWVCAPEHFTLTSWSDLPEQWTIAGVHGFLPHDDRHGWNHSIAPNTSIAWPMLDFQHIIQRPNVKYSLVVEHPIAHIQNQPMMVKSWDYVVSLQRTWSQVSINATRGSLHQLLQEKGITIANLMAFDGIPQFFPTQSGGSVPELSRFRNEADFREHGAYPGWIPDFGSRCRGPLPPNSNLTTMTRIGREAYQTNGLNMEWYGRTWEFINLFWFQMPGTQAWGSRGGIDCTHGTMQTGIGCMHKYFLMSMVEDEIEKQNNHKSDTTTRLRHEPLETDS